MLMDLLWQHHEPGVRAKLLEKKVALERKHRAQVAKRAIVEKHVKQREARELALTPPRAKCSRKSTQPLIATPAEEIAAHQEWYASVFCFAIYFE